jgi:hypothetical protein
MTVQASNVVWGPTSRTGRGVSGPVRAREERHGPPLVLKKRQKTANPTKAKWLKQLQKFDLWRTPCLTSTGLKSKTATFSMR